ncbi:hypothetical protein HPB47_026168, partial [Ixodes persulcatus]
RAIAEEEATSSPPFALLMWKEVKLPNVLEVRSHLWRPFWKLQRTQLPYGEP